MSNIDIVSAKPATHLVGQADRRQSERTYTVFRVARLIMPDGDQLGIVRNISEHGIMLELHARTAVGDRITLDLGEGHRLVGEVRWCDAMAAGLSFIEPINVADVLGKAVTGPENADGKVPRLPRVRTDSPAEITLAKRNLPARLVNISIGGACVETDAPITPSEQIALTIPSLPTKVGSVRWKRGNLAGIVFGRPLSVHALMEWLANRQQAEQPVSQPVARLSDARLADLYLTSVDQLALVVVTDRQGMIVSANRRFQEWSGYWSDQLVGMNFLELQAARRAEGLIEELAREGTWRGELELVGRNGSSSRLSAMVVGATGRPDLLTCFLFEIAGQAGTRARAAAFDRADDAVGSNCFAVRGGADAAALPDMDPASPKSARSGAGTGRKAARQKNDRSPVLSRRELQVLRRVANGLSNEEIGAEIGLSRRTVEIYRASLLGKLGAKNTASAVLIACKVGIL